MQKTIYILNIYIYMLVTICAKLPYAYRHHHTGIGPHTHMVIYFNTVRVSLNIGPHTGMVRV